jgi:hypothetical protein
MPDNLPLQIQRLGGFTEQVLILCHAAQLRSELSGASPAEIKRLFLSLHLPPPSNVSQYLAHLGRKGLAMQPFKGVWAITPLGEERVRELMGEARIEDIRTLGTIGAEPSLSNAPHHLIPPEMAPSTFQVGISRFLEGHPFDRNVFGISRFPRGDEDPVGAALEQCRSVCARHALDFHLAADRAVTEMLFGNVAAGMWACRYGIAVFENRAAVGLNYNAVLEVGAMLMAGRRCLLLKDTSIDRLPTDLIGHIYYGIDLSDPDSVAEAVDQWITRDIAA